MRRNPSEYPALAKRPAPRVLRALAAACLLAAPALAQEAEPEPEAEVPQVPSGQVVALHEVIREEGTLRWRFIAPGVRGQGIEDNLEDMQAICDGFVVPRLEPAEQEALIIVSLMDRIVDFGESDPDARQHFEAYRIVDNLCIWEVY